MEIALRLVAAALLAWAAVAKARRPGDAAGALRAIGVPSSGAPALVWGLVVVEAGLAVVLLSGAPARPVGLALAALGATFALVLSISWARLGARLPCACFGVARERPAPLLLSRALGLVVLGGLIAVGVGDPSRDALVGGALAVLALSVLVLAVMVLALYRQVGVLSQRLGPRAALELAEEGPPVGIPAPALRGLAGRGAELVAFGSVSCRLCAELAPALRALDRTGLAVLPVDEEAQPEAFDAWQVPGTPFVAYLVDGVVRAKGLVNTLEQIEGLVATGAERARHAV